MHEKQETEAQDASDVFKDDAFVSFGIRSGCEDCWAQFIYSFAKVRLDRVVAYVSVCITEQVAHFQSYF